MMMNWNTQRKPGVRHLTLDIETFNAEGSALEMERRFLKPAGNCKSEAARKKSLTEKQAGLEEKAALLDASPVACIGVKADAILAIFCQYPLTELAETGIQVFSAEDESGMLALFADFLSQYVGEDTTFISFNGLTFDLPKLRLAYARHGLPIPVCILPHSDTSHYDVMRTFGKYYSIDGSPFVSLSRVVALLGIAEGKTSMEGKEVPKALARGEYLIVSLYNLLDVLLTEAAYLRMTGEVSP